MNRNRYKWIIMAVIGLLLGHSCDKYLDIQPKGFRLLRTIEDFELWLESDFLQTQVPSELNYLADTKDNNSLSNPPAMSDWLFTWQEQFNEDPKATPMIWAHLYKAIYYYNTVIQEVDKATTGTVQQKEALKAEAKIGRAFTYLQLVNLYGKSYSTSTASIDLAVPFVETNDLNADTPNRSTVKEIYDYIIADLTEALPHLPRSNDANRFRGSIAAAYSILARTYLYMGNYPEAAKNAQLALDNGPNVIVDYSGLSQAATIPQLKRRGDAIFARYLTGRGSPDFPTLDLLKSYNRQDKRLNLFNSNIPVMPNLGGYVFNVRGRTMYWPGGLSMTGTFVYPNVGTSVAEMRLILAEAAARSNDLTAACNQLHEVRKCRFAPTDYVRFDSQDKELVLTTVLKERIFEFPFHGMRWFDMRRLAAEGRMETVTRLDRNGVVAATLEPNSPRYTLQIPMQVMIFNPNWEQNP